MQGVDPVEVESGIPQIKIVRTMDLADSFFEFAVRVQVVKVEFDCPPVFGYGFREIILAVQRLAPIEVQGRVP
jgi:hypothetical protein